MRSLVPARTRILADRCYATGPFVAASPRLRLGALLRLKRHRKGYRKAPPPGVGKRGAPRKDGDLFQGSRPQPWGEPAAIWPGSEKPRRPVTVQAWQQLHCRQARQGVLTVYRVRRQGATGSRRDPRERWFVWGGQSPLPLAEVVSGYQRRFSHEHTYRFRHRKICSRRRGRCARHSSSSGFCVVVAPAMNHLVVARSLAQACYRRL